MQAYDSPTLSSSSISQDNNLGILSRTAPSSGLFLPSPSSRPFGLPYEEQLENSLPPTPTKLSPLFVDRITRESNLSKPQHAELQKMLAVRQPVVHFIFFLIFDCRYDSWVRRLVVDSHCQTSQLGSSLWHWSLALKTAFLPSLLLKGRLPSVTVVSISEVYSRNWIFGWRRPFTLPKNRQ